MQYLSDALYEFEAIRNGDDEKKDNLLFHQTPSNPPVIDETDRLKDLHPTLANALEKAGITQLYRHQVDAVTSVFRGEDVVLEAPTASGKTLSFSIPMFEMLLREPDSHVLMIYPMKAVCYDQRRQIEEISKHIEDFKIESWTYDGDIKDRDERRLLRESPPAILLTNPEMLHLSFLGWSEQWLTFLKKIRLIVIDEMHEYRGYFGTNFSLLFKRFLLKLSRLGNRPQLFLATATCANPKEHAERLTGRALTEIRAGYNIQPERHFYFINPLTLPDYKFSRFYQHRIARATLACLSNRLSTIVFCPSRKFAEEIYKKTKKEAGKFEIDVSEIISYRSGYTSEERREIEEGLRDGRYKAVFSTNALELGIDIGRLDVCILVGFPDSVMSAWQRIGRAGRSFDKSSHILYFAMNNAVDQFYAENIHAFLEKPLDEIVIGLDNEDLIGNHLPFALDESEWTLSPEDRAILGEGLFDRIETETKSKKPITGGSKPPYPRLNLRGGSNDNFKLMYRRTEIGTMSDTQRFREAYIGAYYDHCGTTYRVKSHGLNEIELEEPENSSYKTDPSFYTTIQASEVMDGYRFSDCISVFLGKLTIYENFLGYKLLNDNDEEIDQITTQDSLRKHAHAFWLQLEECEHFTRQEIANGIKTIEQILRIGSLFIIPCDRYDTGTYSINKEVYIYENVPGGIGIAEKSLSIWKKILEQGCSIAKKCTCEEG